MKILLVSYLLYLEISVDMNDLPLLNHVLTLVNIVTDLVDKARLLYLGLLLLQRHDYRQKRVYKI